VDKIQYRNKGSVGRESEAGQEVRDAGDPCPKKNRKCGQLRRRPVLVSERTQHLPASICLEEFIQIPTGILIKRERSNHVKLTFLSRTFFKNHGPPLPLSRSSSTEQTNTKHRLSRNPDLVDVDVIAIKARSLLLIAKPSILAYSIYNRLDLLPSLNRNCTTDSNRGTLQSCGVPQQPLRDGRSAHHPTLRLSFPRTLRTLRFIHRLTRCLPSSKNPRCQADYSWYPTDSP
jgi:hypothetical protein